eukprot:CAMPEP_0179159198 /NCGR_PEP_ID=MMETSP0796-20121207/77732_1 /TAXON_ID=73915 /ORGANISM="Pyrodinium bahamense, Strain pbaha01" /LENGTH=69 /DNA_ID=CAMNT_0020860953 /DNA_START=19 /DNA_END=225 /DNA_ORIENTATION=-
MHHQSAGRQPLPTTSSATSSLARAPRRSGGDLWRPRHSLAFWSAGRVPVLPATEGMGGPSIGTHLPASF